jgi:hypothetical protein
LQGESYIATRNIKRCRIAVIYLRRHDPLNL